MRRRHAQGRQSTRRREPRGRFTHDRQADDVRRRLLARLLAVDPAQAGALDAGRLESLLRRRAGRSAALPDRPARSRSRGCCCRWMPRPELWLVFDIPSEVLQARDRRARRRGSDAPARRVSTASCAVTRTSSCSMPTSRSIEVVAQAERAIVAQLARRTARATRLAAGDDAAIRQRPMSCCSSAGATFRCSAASCACCSTATSSAGLPPDVHLPHPYGIVVHPQAVIGRRVTLMQQVTIGGRDHRENIAPVIGDDVYIGAGARVLGDVRIGNGVVIGANAVVTRDIPPGVTVVGANRIVATRALPAGERHASITRIPASACSAGPTSWRRQLVAARPASRSRVLLRWPRTVPISATLAGL